MKDNITLVAVKCNLCNVEFFITVENQVITCPGCGVKDKCEVVVD